MAGDLEEQYVCAELLDLLSRSVAARVDRRLQSAAELAEALARLPRKLIVEPVVISAADQEKQLYDEIDRRVADARARNETARQQLDRREWKAAVATLETIFHPVMRDEEEWEYACRGAANTQALCGWSFYFRAPTNTLSAQQANFSDSALGRTCKVGSYEANTLGIFDMHGNVREWCEDAYKGTKRAIRGGDWSDSVVYLRAVTQLLREPADTYNFLGLRLARVPSGK